MGWLAGLFGGAGGAAAGAGTAGAVGSTAATAAGTTAGSALGGAGAAGAGGSLGSALGSAGAASAPSYLVNMGPAATAGEGALSKALTGIGMPNVPASLRYSNLLGIENPTAKGIMDTMQRLGAGTGGSVPRAQPINLQPGQVVIQPRAGQRRRMF